MRVDPAAFTTITTAAIATGGLAIAAATAASSITMVALGALAAVSAAFNISSITAWFDSGPNDSATDYFKRTVSHLGKAIPAVVSFISQVFLQAIIGGAVEGLRNLVREKIDGHGHHRARA